jgi:hypothetical protein
MHALDLTALLLRVIVAITMLAHGWNHAFGGSGGGSWSLDGALGIRLDAWTGLLLAVGLGCASAAATLAFGWHRPRPDNTAAESAEGNATKGIHHV